MINDNLNLPFSRISVIGLGYIGLPTAAVLASRKIQVIGIDVNDKTVDIINQGQVHIVEPELDIIVHAAVVEGFLEAKIKPQPADAFLIAVPTPCTENHQPDVSFIESAAFSIAPVLKPGDLVVLESTSPVGTTEQMAEWLASVRPDLTFPQTAGEHSDVRIAYCPERVMPGHILDEVVKNDRIIGGMTPRCSGRAAQLYKIFVEGECIITNVRTAEMCKLTENSFRDVNIAFANEISMICANLNINVWELINLANRHPRVNILRPGPGVGGHCIAVDPWFIVSRTPKEAQLIRMAREVNDHKPVWIVENVQIAIAAFLQENPAKTARDVTITCFGLTFKANIDDIRESPALAITEKIASGHPGPVFAVEPYLSNLPSRIVNKVELKSASEAIAETDIIVILVAHKLFNHAFDKVPARCKIIDTQGVFN